MNDSAIIDAYLAVSAQSGASADDIVETPELRQQFLDLCRGQMPNVPERELLHRLILLRKNGRLPRSRTISSPRA